MADSLSQIAIEKLNKNNFQVWKFKIMNFLMGKGYWVFITSDEKEPLLLENPTQQQIQANKTWHEKEMKILYCLFVNVSDFVATLALGSQPRQWSYKVAGQEEARESRQRGCKGAGQEETQESHHILPGV